MVRMLATLAFGSAFWVCPATAQVTAAIESGGSQMVATVYAPQGPSGAPTVVLVPGWGGGPTDVLGLGSALSSRGIGVVTFSPRGWHNSEGTSTFANALLDIGAAVAWVTTAPEAAELGLTSRSVVLGGHSWGGGMSLAHAAGNPAVQRVFSIAGTDHGQFIRQYHADPGFASMVEGLLTSSRAPNGPIRFEVAVGLREMAEGQDIYGLIENASALGDRDVLLIGGWEDVNVTVDDTLLPLYRALRSEGSTTVRFNVYHADHGFGSVREELTDDLVDWIGR